MNASVLFVLGALIVAAPHFSKRFSGFAWALFTVLSWVFMWLER